MFCFSSMFFLLDIDILHIPVQNEADEHKTH